MSKLVVDMITADEAFLTALKDSDYESHTVSLGTF